MNAHLLRFDKTKKLVFFDFETFNLNLSFQFNRPWQTGLLWAQGDKIIKTEEYWIKWQNCDLRIGAGAAAVTHYNQEEFDSKAVFAEECFENIYNALEEADYIVGQNTLGFDLYLVRDWWRMNGKPWRHLVDKFIDTNCIARGIKMNTPYKPGDNLLEYQYRTLAKKVKGMKTNLTALGKEYNIEHDYTSLHQALSDVELNFKVWRKLIFAIEI